MSIKLMGVQISNYYNVVKIGLLEKGLEFEEIYQPPSQEEDLLTKSPMGKIPVIEVAEGCISESGAILSYLERLQPEPALFPADPFTAGRAQQIHTFIDQYLDSPVRRLLGAAFFGAQTSPEEIEAVKQELAKGVRALKRIGSFDAYIAGATFSHADIAAFTQGHFISLVLGTLGQGNPIAEIDGYSAYVARLMQRPAFAKTGADQSQALKKMMAERAAGG